MKRYQQNTADGAGSTLLKLPTDEYVLRLSESTKKKKKKTNPLGGTQLHTSENLTLLQVIYNKIELPFKVRHKQKVPRYKIRFN